jgi:hypothetical protein
MPFELGVVCGLCDRYSTLGCSRCTCGHLLGLGQAVEERAAATPPQTASGPGPARDVLQVTAPRSAVQAAAGLSEPPPSLFATDELRPRRTTSSGSNAALAGVAPRAQERDSALSSALGFDQDGAANLRAGPARSEASPEELMDQAKNYVCRSCSTPVPLGHKFCGRCGAAIPPEIVNARTQFFGQLQMPGKAKLILIRGDGIEGLSYQLNAEQHLVGRSGQLVFPDDAFVSPRHANLFYRTGKLVVRDEGIAERRVLARSWNARDLARRVVPGG